MPIGTKHRAVTREVTGEAGEIEVMLALALRLSTSAALYRRRFIIAAGECATFTLQYGLSQEPEPSALEIASAIAATAEYWRLWAGRFTSLTDWPDAVKRSLITLQALSDAETGGLIAAPTTSMPEVPGGKRNWTIATPGAVIRPSPYRHFSTQGTGRRRARGATGSLRAAAGAPERLRTIYRVDGSRRFASH